jgi:hypothetical protein
MAILTLTPPAQDEMDCLLAERDDHIQKIEQYEERVRIQNDHIWQLQKHTVIKTVTRITALLAGAAIVCTLLVLLWPSLQADWQASAVNEAAETTARQTQRQANNALCQNVCTLVDRSLVGSYKKELPGTAVCECASATEDTEIQIPRILSLPEIKTALEQSAGACPVMKPVCTQAELADYPLHDDEINKWRRDKRSGSYVLKVQP